MNSSMNFQKKQQYHEWDTNIMIYTEEQMAIYLRKNFSLTHNIFNSQIIKTYTNRLQQLSVIRFYLIDKIFFKPLSEFFSLGNVQLKKLITTDEFKELIEITLIKIKMFEEIIIEQMKTLLNYKISKLELQNSNQNNQLNKTKQQALQQIKKKLFPHSLKVVQLYCNTNRKNQPLKISKSHSKYNIIRQDYYLSICIREQLDRIKQGQNIQKLQRYLPIQKYRNMLNPKPTYCEFLQKICYYYTAIQENIAFRINNVKINSLHVINQINKSDITNSTYYSQISQVQLQCRSENDFAVDKNQPPSKKIKSDQTNNKLKKTASPQKIVKNVQKIPTARLLQVAQNFTKNLAIQRPISVKCLNCVQYFYKGLPVSIQRNHLVNYQILNSIQMIKESQDTIRQIICSIINQGGGTILFGSKKTKFGFIPIGQTVKLKDQQSYKASFEHLFKCLNPQAYQKLIDYKIDFIPLKQNPLQKNGKLIENKLIKQIQRFFVPELYVMRVKIIPKSGKQFFGCKIDQKIYYISRQNGNSVQYKISEEFYNQIKRRNYCYTQIKNIESLQMIKKQLGNNFYERIIRGRRYIPLNLHEGKCLETLTLSTETVKIY